jgi:hypothetical protein
MSAPTNIRGDCNNNGNVDGLDVVYLQRLLLEDPNNPMVLAHEQQYDLDNNGQINGLDVVYLQRMLLDDPNNPQIPINTEPPVLNLIYKEESDFRETMTVQPGAGFPDNHYLQTGHLVMNDKGEGVTRQHYKFYPTALPDINTWGAAGDDTPFDTSVNIHPTLAGTQAAGNPNPSVAGHNDDYNDKTPQDEVYNNWDIWNKYNSLAEQKMFTDVDLLPDDDEDGEVDIVNPESTKIHFCVTSYLMETNDVFVNPTNTQDTTEANLKASRFAVGDAKAFARTAFKLNSARPYTVFSRELFDNNGPISAIPLNDANVDHELTVIPVATNVDKYRINMAGDLVSYKIQPGEGEGRLQIIQDMDLGQGQYTHSSSFAFAGEKKIYRFNNNVGITTPLTLSLCHDRTNVSVNVKLNGQDVTNSDSCVDGKFIQNITFPENQVSDIEITTIDPTQTGDYTMTLIETVDNIPATNVAFDETRLLTLDATQTWTQSMIDEVTEALNKWESVITATPAGTKISPTFSLQSFTDDTQFSQSIVNTTNMETFNGDHANFQITKGAVVLNKSKYVDHWNNGDNTNSHSVTDHAIIELGHVLGIGTMWNKDVTVDETPLIKPTSNLIDMGTNNEGYTVNGTDPVKKVGFYRGANALQFYTYATGSANFDTLVLGGVDTQYSNGNNTDGNITTIESYTGIPIQHDPSINLIDNLKIEEGRIGSVSQTNLQITDNDGAKTYLGVGAEYMSSEIENPDTTLLLSALSIGMLQDLGYQVNYANADRYDLKTHGDSIN